MLNSLKNAVQRLAVSIVGTVVQEKTFIVDGNRRVSLELRRRSGKLFIHFVAYQTSKRVGAEGFDIFKAKYLADLISLEKALQQLAENASLLKPTQTDRLKSTNITDFTRIEAVKALQGGKPFQEFMFLFGAGDELSSRVHVGQIALLQIVDTLIHYISTLEQRS